jgi:hypothetical protein
MRSILSNRFQCALNFGPIPNVREPKQRTLRPVPVPVCVQANIQFQLRGGTPGYPLDDRVMILFRRLDTLKHMRRIDTGSARAVSK